MGETMNTVVSGQAKVVALCHAKKLEERYKGKKYNELAAVDQLAIDQAYDSMIKEVRPQVGKSSTPTA